MRHYPRAKLLRLDALAAVAAWVLGGTAGALYFAAIVLAAEVPKWAFLMGFAAFAVAALAHAGLALMHRCPECGKHPTVQGFGALHPCAAAQSRLSGWSGAVWNVFRRNRMVCIHCGTPYVVSESAA
jgi:hypothetical protein